MSVALRSTLLARPCWSSNALRRISSFRSYSTGAPAVDGTLPLAGIRVLDMTRVLAGVSQYAATIAILFCGRALTK